MKLCTMGPYSRVGYGASVIVDVSDTPLKKGLIQQSSRIHFWVERLSVVSFIVENDKRSWCGKVQPLKAQLPHHAASTCKFDGVTPLK